MTQASISSSSSSHNTPKQTFPTYLKARNALLNLVHRQANAAGRIRVDPHELSRLANARQKMKQVKSVDKFTLTEDRGVTCCQLCGGHGDTLSNSDLKSNQDGRKKKQKNKKKVQPVEYDEEFDLGWTLHFDSKEDLLEYKKNYLSAVESLGAECSVSCNPSMQTFIKTEAGECEKPTVKSSRPKIRDTSQNVPVSVSKQSNSARDLHLAKSIHKAVSKHLSPIPCCSLTDNYKLSSTVRIFILVLTLLVIMVVFEWWPMIYTLFDYIEQVEWPWLVFMREPLLKGFVYSTNFEFFQDEDDTYWSS